MPLTGSFVVACVDDLVSEFDVTHELVLVHDILEMLLYLVARRVEGRPVTLKRGELGQRLHMVNGMARPCARTYLVFERELVL